MITTDKLGNFVLGVMNDCHGIHRAHVTLDVVHRNAHRTNVNRGGQRLSTIRLMLVTNVHSRSAVLYDTADYPSLSRETFTS